MDRSRLSIVEARDLVVGESPRRPTVSSPPADAVGCVLAAPVVSREDVPPFANSAVDGYAVIAADTATASAASPVELRVVGEVAAGAASEHVLAPGEAIRIMTGAPVPPGADAVVMVEDTSIVGDRTGSDARVAIRAAASPGQAVRGAGDDIRAGETVFDAGTVIRPAVVGVLASINAGVVEVTARVRVAVLSTGDELIDDGGPLAPGQIRESNKTMLLGLVADAGAVAVDYGVVRDDEAALEATLRRAAQECDAIITSGGVSMGDYDVVRAVLSRIATMRWLEIMIRPAKPFAFGQLRDAEGVAKPVFGLPGNPVSSLVSFELIARPALRTMMGHDPSTLMRPSVLAVADGDLRRSPDGKVHYQRVHGAFADDGRYHVRARGPQGSHQLAASSLANTLVELPDGDGVAAGGDVRAYLLHP